MILLIGAGLVLLCGLAWRWPTALLAVSLLSLGVGFYWFLPDYLPQVPAGVVLVAPNALVAFALAANAVRHGVRTSIRNWPVVVAVVLVLQSILVADLGQIDAAHITVAAFALALPWAFVQVVLEPGSRHVLVHVVALTPALAVGVGAVLDAYGIMPLFLGYRLQGATNAGWLSFAAYAGFAVALHEAFRTLRRRFAYLAALNLGIAMLSVGRMGILACLLFALVYLAFSGGLRHKLGRLGMAAAVSAGIVVAVAMFTWPLLEARFVPDSGGLNLSGRDRIWSGYLAEFWTSPVFGRGLGSASRLSDYFALPHNEYLRVLVEGGIVGFALFVGAVASWGRQLLARVDADGRAFLIAAFASLAAYATTDNVLIMPPALLLFAYFGVLLERRRHARVARSGKRRSEGRSELEPDAPRHGREPAPWQGARPGSLWTGR